MDPTRRNFLRSFFGAGSLGLASLATGLPLALLANPRRALADPPVTCADVDAAQFLILSTSGLGDPLNANVPGSYVTQSGHSVQHADHPTMAGTPFMLGAQQATGAQYWSTLGNPGASTPLDPGHGTPGAAASATLARTCFFHHATYTNSHPNEFKVLELMGATTGSESIPSMYSKYLQGCLGTIQPEPIVVSGVDGVVSFDGRPLGSLTPTALADTLATDGTSLGQLLASVSGAQMATLRDRHLDNINAVLRQGATTAQRNYVDALVTARQQARAIPDALLGMFSTIQDDDAAGQCIAAIALIRMKVSPAVVISIPFGGDNHSDPGLITREQPQTVAGIDQIGALMQALAAAGLADKVTFAMLNVFGRTPSTQGTTGRGHWANHHAGVVISSRTQGGVVGGMVFGESGDFEASPFNSTTGAMDPGGDVVVMKSLESFATTLGRTLGVPSTVLAANISGGVAVGSALTAAARG